MFNIEKTKVFEKQDLGVCPELILRGRTPYLKSFKARAARNRVEFNHSITEMVAHKEGEMNKERDEKELRQVNFSALIGPPGNHFENHFKNSGKNAQSRIKCQRTKNGKIF